MGIIDLWLPILLSAIGVFIASSIIHVALKFWHHPDFRGLPNEAEVAGVMREGDPAPGMYLLPYVPMEQMKDPDQQVKYREGPVGFLIVRAPGLPNMGMHLGLWFLYCLVVSAFTAWVGAATLVPGAAAMQVACVLGVVSFMAYGFSAPPVGIWWGQPWKSVFKDVIDGVVYAAITGALFAWLWPQLSA